MADYDSLSVGDVSRRLAETIAALVGMHAALAKQEAREDLHRAVRAIIWVAVGVVLAAFAVVCVLIALVAGTAAALQRPLWLAALVWIVLLAVPGGVCLYVGQRRFPRRPLTRTRAEVKESFEWAKRRLIPPAN